MRREYVENEVCPGCGIEKVEPGKLSPNKKLRTAIVAFSHQKINLSSAAAPAVPAANASGSSVAPVLGVANHASGAPFASGAVSDNPRQPLPPPPTHVQFCNPSELHSAFVVFFSLQACANTSGFGLF